MPPIDDKNIRRLSTELVKSLTPTVNAFIESKKDFVASEVLAAISEALGIVAVGVALSQQNNPGDSVQLAIIMSRSIHQTVLDVLNDPKPFTDETLN